MNDIKVYPETYPVRRRLSIYFRFGKYSITKCETCVDLAFLCIQYVASLVIRQVDNLRHIVLFYNRTGIF